MWFEDLSLAIGLVINYAWYEVLGSWRRSGGGGGRAGDTMVLGGCCHYCHYRHYCHYACHDRPHRSVTLELWNTAIATQFHPLASLAFTFVLKVLASMLDVTGWPGWQGWSECWDRGDRRSVAWDSFCSLPRLARLEEDVIFVDRLVVRDQKLDHFLVVVLRCDG